MVEIRVIIAIEIIERTYVLNNLNHFWVSERIDAARYI